MSKRGNNPVRAVRWGAVVMLAAGGTVAALVVSEWPQTGVRIAQQAKTGGGEGAGRRVAAAPSGGPVRPVYFTAEEPDLSGHSRPGLMITGSSEEARRELQEQSDASPPAKPHGLSRGSGCESTWMDLAEYVDWWKSTPTGKIVEEVSSYEPGRTGATVRISPEVDLVTGVTRFNTGDSAGVGSVMLGDSTEPRNAEVYDFTVRLDALAGESLGRGVDFGVLAGARAASLFDRAQRNSTVTDPLPVIGGDARYKWSERSMLRASALGEAPGTIRDYVDLRLEQVWRLGGDSSLSVGWRHMRGVMSNELPEPTLRQDAILLELKIGF